MTTWKRESVRGCPREGVREEGVNSHREEQTYSTRGEGKTLTKKGWPPRPSGGRSAPPKPYTPRGEEEVQRVQVTDGGLVSQSAFDDTPARLGKKPPSIKNSGIRTSGTPFLKDVSASAARGEKSEEGPSVFPNFPG